MFQRVHQGLKLLKYLSLLLDILAKAEALRQAPQGTEVLFSGVRFHHDGHEYEISGIIKKLR